MNIWIGYNDLVLRGSYQWSDNSRTTYTNWFNGQPDDTARRGSCVKAALNQGYRSFLSWTDDDCSTLNSFMCKKLKRNHIAYVLGHWYFCYSRTRKQGHNKIKTYRLISWKNSPKDKNQKLTDFFPCSYEMVHYIELKMKCSNSQFQGIG